MNHTIEQQKEALDNLHRNRTVAPSRADLHKIITQTHQATIAEVVRIAEGMGRIVTPDDRIESAIAAYGDEQYNQALTDLIEAITSNKE
jgi:hypothetical protein